MDETKTVAIIGGSGLYNLEELSGIEEVNLITPFGKPSDTIISGFFGDVRILFLPRHGRGHQFLPSEVPYLANIWALKKLGASWCIGLSAVGSLKEEIKPGDIVFVDQYIDRTHRRRATFFGDGVAGHVSFGKPVSSVLQEVLVNASCDVGANLHVGGTYVCMEGPAFSTRAESELHRSWGASVIGMTGMPEAKLAREAEIAYTTVALVTDYDCWYDAHGDVSVEEVVRLMRRNTETAKRIISRTIPRIPQELDPMVQFASRNAIMTPREYIPSRRLTELEPIIGHYFNNDT